MTTKKLDYIDTMRGIAILGVMMVHTIYTGNIALEGSWGNIAKQGARGVQLFFVVSAFTLFLSVKSRLNKERFPIRNFFIRRFFRIAPLYYLALCYYVFENHFWPTIGFHDEAGITPGAVLANTLFVHAFSPYWINSVIPGGWSIGVEMIFYAVLPFLFSRIKNMNSAFIFFILSLLLRFLLEKIFTHYTLIPSYKLLSDFLFYYFPSQLPIFALGIIMYFIVNEDSGVNFISGKSLLAFAGILVVQFLFITKFNIFTYHILFSLNFLILGIAFSKLNNRFIVNPGITFIGKISFSMYLVHIAVLHWLKYFHFTDYVANPFLNFGIRYLIVCLLTGLISIVTYRTIEIPFQKLGKRIIDRMDKNPKLEDARVA